MRTICESEIWTFCDSRLGVQRVKRATVVRKAPGCVVTNYLDLATKVAELQFKNPDFVLMFRGESSDHHNLAKNTSLKPSLFRPEPGSKRPPSGVVLESRFDVLRKADGYLIDEYRLSGMPELVRLVRYRILRWAILQHYEVCPTPLLDLTHSLRIAASFATEQGRSEAFLFVLGVPNLSGAITASAEAGLQIIRLSSVCPPTALRPHKQEGYLLGEYPDLADYNQKQSYEHHEIDFGHRLIAKFRFNPVTFWNDAIFPKVSREALYPNELDDPLNALTQRVKRKLEEP